MGALHLGHISLVERALDECDRVICSIFVNPLQFNDPGDLARYPRQPEQDLRLLEAVGCHAAFLPKAQDLFAAWTRRSYDLGTLDTVLEGKFRPGHFQGVANVVERLFHYMRPDRAYFGEKDRQQLSVIQHLVELERWPVQIHGCPTLREKDGLAMSSRNQRLDPSERSTASALYRSLKAAEAMAPVSLVSAAEAGRASLATVPGLRLEYFTIADPRTLEPVRAWGELDRVIVLVAAWLGEVRLIDNLEVRR